LPNVGPYIYDVSISGFTRSSIYIYDISSLRVNEGFLPGLKPWWSSVTGMLCVRCLYLKCVRALRQRADLSRNIY